MAREVRSDTECTIELFDMAEIDRNHDVFEHVSLPFSFFLPFANPWGRERFQHNMSRGDLKG
ncbi:hypothetical protein GCM10023209_09500 [Roseibacterium beibuensis]|uniref:Uncharacterized protein n=1 Tax=[Roseibacterium] beibuensis TaxID=1193142 RepID=A0ABP9L3E5_9RHOB